MDFFAKRAINQIMLMIAIIAVLQLSQNIRDEYRAIESQQEIH